MARCYETEETETREGGGALGRPSEHRKPPLRTVLSGPYTDSCYFHDPSQRDGWGVEGKWEYNGTSGDARGNGGDQGHDRS